MANFLECNSEECLSKGLHLRLSFYQFPVYVTSMVDEETTEMRGVIPEFIIPFVFGKLNITLEFTLSDTFPYGTPKTNESWAGDLGMLQKNVSDIAVGMHTLDSYKFSDFCPFKPYQRLSVVILASAGTQEMFDFFSFLNQVDSLIWHLLILSMFLIMITSSVSDSILDEKAGKNFNIRRHLWRAFWIYLASVFCEGSAKTMLSRRGQMLQFLWLFSILVMVNVLYSQFKGILAVRSDEGFLRSIQDLADTPNVLPLIVRNSGLEYVLKDSPLTSYKKVYEKALRKPDEAFIDMSKHMNVDTYQLIKGGRHALVTTLPICKYFLKNICTMLTGKRKLYFIDEILTYLDMVFYTKWDIPNYLRDRIDQRFLSMDEGGFTNLWFSNYYRNFEECEEFTENDNNCLLELKHMKTAIYLYLFLLLISFVVFLLEFFVSK